MPHTHMNDELHVLVMITPVRTKKEERRNRIPVTNISVCVCE